MSLDTAVKTGDHNDFSVAIIALVRGQEIYLQHVWRERVIYPDLKHRVSQLCADFNVDTLLVEDSVTGSVLIHEFQGVGAVIPVKPEGDKMLRLSLASDALEGQMVRLPRGMPWIDEFLDEATAFPVAPHDDQVDSLSQLVHWRRRNQSSTFTWDMGWDEQEQIPDPMTLAHLLGGRGH